jgi:hypothetical protein
MNEKNARAWGNSPWGVVIFVAYLDGWYGGSFGDYAQGHSLVRLRQGIIFIKFFSIFFAIKLVARTEFK